jgi:hypothetical protein
VHHGTHLHKPRPWVVRRTPSWCRLGVLGGAHVQHARAARVLVPLAAVVLGGVKDDDRAGVGVEGPDCLEPLVPVEVVPSEQTPPPSWRCDSVGVHPKEDNF